MRQYIVVTRQLDNGKVIGLSLLEGNAKHVIIEDATKLAASLADERGAEVEFGIYEPLIAEHMNRRYRGVITRHSMKTEG